MDKFKKYLKFDVQGNLTLKYAAQNIGVVIGGWEREEAELQLKIVLKKDAEQNEVEEAIKIEYDTNTNLLAVNLEELEDEFSIRKAQFHINVPFKTKISAKVENAMLSINNLEGEQTLQSENGMLNIIAVKGDIKAETENGMMKFDRIMGDVTAKTENGMTAMKKIKGKITVLSENGMIKISDSTGNLNIEEENGSTKIINSTFGNAVIRAENGNIYYETGKLDKGNLRFENENGKIQLITDEDVPYDITAKNISGSFYVGLKGSIDKTNDGKYKVFHLVNGNGNVKIYMENENGSIKLLNNPISKGGVAFDNFSNLIDEEKISGEVKDKIKIIKQKISKSEIPGILEKVEDIIKNIPEQIDAIKSNKDISNIGNEIKKVVKTKMEEMTNQLKNVSPDTKENEDDEVLKRSRKKIFEMLQDGKIDAEQAEKLIKAMEARNEER